MYVFIPEIFFVPVYYAQEDILNVKKAITLQQGNYDCSFIKKIRDRKDIVIGVSLPNQREARWVKDKEAMEAYANEKGVTLKMEFNEFDAAKQKSQVEDLISQGIDVLIFVPDDVLGAAELVEKAHNAGVKVISYDNLVRNSDPDLYISFNNIRVGELQGRYLTEKVPRGNYIVMSGDPGGTIFKEGAMEFIQPLVNIGNIKIVTDKVIKGWEPTIAFNVVKDSLITNKDKIAAILAPNDATAGAAIEALKEQGLAGKVPVTGQDADLAAVERIIEGTQLMTVLKDTRELAKSAIDAAIKLAKGEVVNTNTTVNNDKINVPAILVNPIAIDKNNINSVLIGSGYYKKEDIISLTSP